MHTTYKHIWCMEHTYTHKNITHNTHAYLIQTYMMYGTYIYTHKHNTQHKCIPHTNIYDVCNIHIHTQHRCIPHTNIYDAWIIHTHMCLGCSYCYPSHRLEDPHSKEWIRSWSSHLVLLCCLCFASCYRGFWNCLLHSRKLSLHSSCGRCF